MIPNTNPNFKLMYATALLVMSTGRPIEGWVNGCLDLWGGTSNKVSAATTMTISKQTQLPAGSVPAFQEVL